MSFSKKETVSFGPIPARVRWEIHLYPFNVITIVRIMIIIVIIIVISISITIIIRASSTVGFWLKALAE